MTFSKTLIIRSAFSFLLVLSALGCLAADFPNENICYDPSIKTIQVFKEGFELSSPVIQLNSTDRLSVQFDDLDAFIKRYKFTILHCESDWQTSTDLTVSDYIDGFREENIDQYDYSYSTTVKYTHFKATFPTQNMRPRLSGNYMLVVYEDDPSQLAFTARFMVTEASPLAITGRVVQSSLMAERSTRQQIDFAIRLNGFQVLDVGREMKVVLMQNGRTDNLLRLSRPRFARTDELDYRYDESISFSGGNQFRNFDIKSLQYQSEHIARIDYDTSNQVYLVPDQPRTFKQYAYEKDLNGRFFIKNEDHADNSSIEADYAWVHFFLPYPVILKSGTFHVLGELTSWQLNDASRMFFNPRHGGYELNLFLKQGYYNYMYVMKENGKSYGDESLIEGNHWEAENEYTIFVYFRETGSLYDRLLAVSILNSIQP
ncbi:MAG: DUF5103 domain-containing protein [Bacteroidales bacterium]|nr:DUF5103 domain-containing protein [Bacteroidales bacterium]